jgi:hypothetical protein
MMHPHAQQSSLTERAADRPEPEARQHLAFSNPVAFTISMPS